MWTYSGDPSSNPKDSVRLLIGDTDSEDQLLQDEEINYFLSSGGSPEYASILACDAVIAKLSRKVDSKVGELSRSASQMAKAYRMLASDLRSRFYASGCIKPSFGGISRDEEISYRNDTDLKSSPFRNEQFDHPGSSNFDTNRSITKVNGGLC